MLSWGYIVQLTSDLTPHFMCWKYFDTCHMNKTLLRISLNKFSKLNFKKSLLNLRYQKLFLQSLYFIFHFHFQHIFYLLLVGCMIYTYFHTIFLTRSQNNVLWIKCVEEIKMVYFCIITFIFKLVTYIFCVSRIRVKESVE